MSRPRTLWEQQYTDCILALAGSISTFRDLAVDLIAWRNLVAQVEQDLCFADIAPGDLDGSNFKRFTINHEIDLAPDPPFRVAILAGAPLAFTFVLVPGTIDQQVQPSLGAAVEDVHG